MRIVNRKIQRQQIAGANDTLSSSYNIRSGALKVLPVGAEFQKNAASGLSAIIPTTATRVPLGSLLAIYNNSASVQWFNMNNSKDGALAAPSSFANAFPLKPNDWTYISVGENDQIMVSSPNVGVYIIVDESSFSIDKEL